MEKTNEPVAWMNPNESSIDYKFSDECAGDWNIPLYTHPVKEDEGKVCARCGAIAYDPVITQTVKELTDEEIADLIANKVTDSEMIKQALRKAQEK